MCHTSHLPIVRMETFYHYTRLESYLKHNILNDLFFLKLLLNLSLYAKIVEAMLHIENYSMSLFIVILIYN